MSGEVTTPRAEEHLGLVHLCANRFRNRGIDYDELYSAGCVGLLKAVKAFDCTRGVQFSTYAVPVILGEIKRLFRDGGIVHISRSLRERAAARAFAYGFRVECPERGLCGGMRGGTVRNADTPFPDTGQRRG